MTMASAQDPISDSRIARLLLASFFVFLGATATALHFESLAASEVLASGLVSSELYRQLAGRFGGSFSTLFAPVLALFVVAWISSGLVLGIRTGNWAASLARQGLGFGWMLVLGLFEVASWVGAAASPDDYWIRRLDPLLPFFHIIAEAGLITHLCSGLLRRQPTDLSRRTWVLPVSAAIAFAVVFSALSILQYQALMVPHGDSAMYEEHLWNLLHGKGFRSQLDSGRLFLGEHLEVIHILLIPAYLLYPSLLTLNLIQVAALASGAIAVFAITRRIVSSDRAAWMLSFSYLLYFPVQYLCLEASLKTFRPENLGVPLLLFAIWALECNRIRSFLSLALLALLCKEDYAIPVAMLGLYLSGRRPRAAERPRRILPLAVFLGSLVYLWLALSVFIPYFRGGAPHYTVYYDLGDTPTEMVANLIFKPVHTWEILATLPNTVFVLALLVPLAGVPLAGFARFWTLLPSLAVVMLISGLPDSGVHIPWFHFHAPLVPILFWSAAEGISRLGTWFGQPGRGLPWVASMVLACSLMSGIWFGKSPLSRKFYDPGSGLMGYWRVLYQPGLRSELFDDVFEQIPVSASVATTDYVRPRFTHHRECHQYPLKPDVPPERIDYILIDLHGPYSDPVLGRRIREWEDDPTGWEGVHAGPMYFLIRSLRERSK